jgi:hypothetical protein
MERESDSLSEERIGLNKLPILKEVFFEITPILKSFEIHRMATTMINRLTSSPSDSHFRVMDLPREIQIMILSKHLVAPGPVIPCRLKGYALFDCYTGRCPQGSRV